MKAPRPQDAQADLEHRLALAEAITGHTFTDRALLQRALTHPSAVEDRIAEASYERLEFLGDSVLGMLVAEEIFTRFPEMPEGGMTRIKWAAVSGVSLSRVAGELGLADAIVFGQSMARTGDRGVPSALEDAFEALTAALYIDGGLPAVSAWVRRTVFPAISQDVADIQENPKGALQELVQARGESPTYELRAQEGPPHARTFHVSVSVAGKQLGEGSGGSKREAEAAAAAVALQTLELQKKRTRRTRS